MGDKSSFAQLHSVKFLIAEKECSLTLHTVLFVCAGSTSSHTSPLSHRQVCCDALYHLMRCSVSTRWHASIPVWHLVRPLTNSFPCVLVHPTVQFLRRHKKGKKLVSVCSVLFYFASPILHNIKTYRTSIYNSAVLYVFIFCKIGLTKENKMEQNRSSVLLFFLKLSNGLIELSNSCNHVILLNFWSQVCYIVEFLVPCASTCRRAKCHILRHLQTEHLWYLEMMWWCLIHGYLFPEIMMVEELSCECFTTSRS